MSLQSVLLDKMMRKGNTKQTVPLSIVEQRIQNEKRMPTKLDKKIQLEEVNYQGLTMEKLTKKGNTKWLLYIHGGGFTTGSAKERRIITQYLVKKFGYNCYSINYRLAPEHKWPAQIEDVYAWYQYLMTQGVDISQLVVIGESAGATLALSLCLKARDEGIALPKAIIALSPPTNHAQGFPSHQKNVDSDIILQDKYCSFEQRKMVYGEHNQDLTYLSNPYVSPYFGDYHDLPPIFLSVSTSEVLYDDSHELYLKLKAAHHPVDIDMQNNQIHAFAIMARFLPEARKSLQMAFEFVEKQ